jgi:LCP family protein required for cell wall assembly
MFELLDDPEAGPPPASFRPAVARRVRRRRRRQAIGAGSLVAASALGVGGLVARDRVEPEKVEVAGLPTEEPAPGAAVTVLFVGLDSGLPGDRDRALADTIVLARIDPTASQVRVLPVPRDLAVPAGQGAGAERISSVVATDGPERLVRTLREELGIDVDRYVQTDVAGAAEIVDALGGLRLSVVAPVRAEETGIELPAGCSTLDGERVVALARARKDVQVRDADGRWSTDRSGDQGRQQRAAAIVAALLDAVGRVGAGELPDLVSAGLDSVVVDSRTDAGDVLRLGRTAASSDVVALWLPVRPAELPDGQQVLVVPDGGGDVVTSFLEGGQGDGDEVGTNAPGPLESTGLRPC